MKPQNNVLPQNLPIKMVLRLVLIDALQITIDIIDRLYKIWYIGWQQWQKVTIIMVW